MKTCFLIAIVVVGLSGGRFSDQKGCCLSSKTREKNVCRGRVIELSTDRARVAEVDRENFVGRMGNLPPPQTSAKGQQHIPFLLLAPGLRVSRSRLRTLDPEKLAKDFKRIPDQGCLFS